MKKYILFGLFFFCFMTSIGMEQKAVSKKYHTYPPRSEKDSQKNYKIHYYTDSSEEEEKEFTIFDKCRCKKNKAYKMGLPCGHLVCITCYQKKRKRLAKKSGKKWAYTHPPFCSCKAPLKTQSNH